MRTFRSLVFSLLIVAALPFSGMESTAFSQSKIIRSKIEVDWGTAKVDAASAEQKDNRVALFKRRYADVLSTTELPVLIPNSSDVDSELQLASQGSAYVVESQLPAASLSLFGNINVLSFSNDQVMSNTATGCKDRFEPSEDGADLNFCRYNAPFVLRLTCDETDDPRCQKDDFLLRVKNGLLVAGGERLQ